MENLNLKQLPYFESFSDEALTEILMFTEIESGKASQVVFAEGDDGACMYFVKSGTIEIRKQGKTLALLGPNSCFGEMALYEEQARSADAIAQTDVVLYRIMNDRFREWLFDRPQFSAPFLFNSVRELSARLRTTNNYLSTVFETGKLLGGHHSSSELSQQVLAHLINGVAGATGGLIALKNLYADGFYCASMQSVEACEVDEVLAALSPTVGDTFFEMGENHALMGIPLIDASRILGYIILEKTGDDLDFSANDKIIVTAVAHQVEMGLLNAYARQEEQNRQRLMAGRFSH